MIAAAGAVLAFLAIALAVGVVLLNEQGSPLNPIPEFVGIEAVTLLGAHDLIAVGGTRGHKDPAVVARSTDDGNQWAARAVPLVELTSISVAGSRLVASRYCLPPSAGGVPLEPAPASCLFASEDGGVTWSDLDAGPLVDPAFADSYGWAHAQFPNGRELYESIDGGLSWSVLDTPCPADKPWLFRAVPTGPQTGYVLCFAEPTDSGQPWALIQRLPSGETATLFQAIESGGEPGGGLNGEFVYGFSINADGQGLIWTSHLYKTTDGGRSWSPVATPGFEGGRFGYGGLVMDGDNAYLVWRTIATTSVVEYRAGTFRTVVTWPWTIPVAQAHPGVSVADVSHSDKTGLSEP